MAWAGSGRGALDGGRHACCLFATDGDRDRIVSGFLATGVASDERLLYLSDDTPARVVLGRLDRLGLDGTALVRDGRLEVRSAEESYLEGGRFEVDRMLDRVRAQVDDALAAGYAGLRITGEMTWAARGRPGSDDLGRYEQALAPLFEDGSLVALCQYDRRSFDDDVTAEVVPHHDLCASATGGGGFVASRDGSAVRLEGDLDFSDAAVLGAYLDAAAAGGDIEVDLQGVEFLDIAAMRVLVSVAKGLPPDGCLRLRNVPASVRRVLSLTGWDATPGLAVA